MSMLLGPLLALEAAAAGGSSGEPLPVAPTSVSSPSNTRTSEQFRQRPLLFELQLGVAMPTGLVGAFVDYAFVPELSLAAGIGSNLTGLVGAGEVRLRALVGRSRAVGFMLGYSAGPHTQTYESQYGVFSVLLGPMSSIGHGTPSAVYHWDLAHWTNLGLFFEERRPSGFTIRVFTGLAVLLNQGDARVSEPREGYDRGWEPSSSMVFLGFGMGYAL